MPKAPSGIAARPFKMKDSFSLAAAVACCRMRETNLSLCAGGNNRFLTEQSAPEQIREIIRRVAPTAKTILYGSQARNEARSDSDIDLLILLDGEKMTLKDEESITLPLYELELKTGVSISPIVTLKKLWESRPFTPPLLY